MIKKTLILFCLTIYLYDGKTQSFNNPILSGFYPDPSICRAGDDYYLVNSSFAYYPGLPLFHSSDLLNWQQIGYAMNRPEQLNLDSSGVSRGLFAPSISYHNGTFYIVCTEVNKLGNFVITARNPKGPWSNPVPLPQVNGIDPSLFFDNNGKTYIVYNSIPPGNVPLHDGHRTIRLFEFDPVNKRVKGEEKLLVNGGTDMAKKPVWIEGPHLLKKDEWYYLICAEGGTGYNHSEVVFRSKSPEGPFVSYEKNPILTQRHLDPDRPAPVTTTGHADLVQASDGNWWGVFLGCRPYAGDYYNTGRETFMAPVVWKQEWPTFDLGGEELKYSYPINARINPAIEPFNGNYLFRDEFDRENLNIRYRFLRTIRQPWYDLSGKPGSLTLNLQAATCSGKENPSFVGFSQPHLKGYAATAIRFTPASANEKAGLLIFQNEKAFYYICKTLLDGRPAIALFKENEMISSAVIDPDLQNIFLKIEARPGSYSFYYSEKGEQEWTLLKAGVDARPLSTKSAGGFVGCLYALYASSEGKVSANTASYDWFEVSSDDDVYKKQ